MKAVESAMRPTGLVAVILFAAACSAEVSDLTPPRGSARDASARDADRPDIGALAPDAEPRDAEPRDAPDPGDAPLAPDAASSCTSAFDCPGPHGACPDPNFCICGTYKTCTNGACTVFTNTFCGDAGVSSPDATPSPGTCQHAGDCTGTGDTVDLCRQTGGLTEWSCLNGACLWACGPARTCTSVNLCVNCEGAPNISCPQVMCFDRIDSANIEQATCPTYPGTNQPFAGTRLSVFRNSRSRCTFDAYPAAGAVSFGQFAFLEDATTAGDFPGLGGICTGVFAPTGALRVIWSCPQCMFVMMF